MLGILREKVRGVVIIKKEDLLQYEYLKKEIIVLERKLKKYKENVVRDKVTGSNNEFPYQLIHITIEGYENSLYCRKLQDSIKKRYKKCLELKIQIEQFIESIDDSRTRLIFELRYIEGYKWQKISKELGAYDESYARKIHDRYLEKNLKNY